ncbi:MAG: indole-3-glycerol phosphate synthase TrpC [Candidatus Moranbacteria bacterium]|nr:indole-3-glycerol phosphate synthase TrpC [Candidatus Moranbacteria bacterium]
MLRAIIKNKKIELDTKKKKHPLKEIQKECFEFLNKNNPKDYHRSFKSAIVDGKSVGLIAEIKLASPSTGKLTEISCTDVAKKYNKSKADVISVLTDEKYFNGHLSYLRKVREICHQPIFRKDFIVDSYQIYETALHGADAFLLIASVLTLDEMKQLIQLGKEVGLECLVETHDENDVEKAIQTSAEIIGINNRDLKTMKTDLGTTERLMKSISGDRIVISESGINNRDDVERMIGLGVKGVLVGTSIIKSENMIDKINSLKE